MVTFDKSQYESKRLFRDESFEDGFDILRVDNGKDGYIPI